MIQLDVSVFLKPLATVQSLIERKTLLPVLSHILLEDDGQQTTLFASNREIEIAWTLPVSSGVHMACTLPAHKFYDLCRNLPAKTVLTLEIEENRVVIHHGKSRFIFNSFTKNDFPFLEHHEHFSVVELQADRLDMALARVQFAMASQDIRQYLNGVLFDFIGDRLNVVATDGHRLALDQMAFSGSPLAKQMIIPKKTIAEMRKILGGEEQITLKIGERLFEMRTGSIALKSTIIDGRYPDYQKVIPKDHPYVLHAERIPLLQALERCAIMTKERNDGILLSLTPDTLILSTRNTEQEEAIEELAATYRGDPLEIAFNHSYLTEGLSHLSSAEIIFTLQDNNSSAVLRLNGEDDPYRYVMMPMRI